MINRTMQDRFNRAKSEPEIKQAAAEIEELWNLHSQPEPDQGPTTGAMGNRHMVEYSEADQEPVVDRYNSLVELLWDLVDEFHIGLGIWYTHYYKTPKWKAYYSAAEQLISEFILDSLWTAVCNNWVEWAESDNDIDEQVRQEEAVP
ncbi:MAG: hypothetical protein WBL02_07445 [Methanomethylovorans sp.]|uniref:hypothetical protein n=1 Tax=Methanomethylovorans sp. TaxID=2758717 RepID=UPI003C73E619